MSCNVIVVGPRDRDIPDDKGVISTVSKSKSSLWRQLSPFVLGPCRLWKDQWSMNMENGWQYSKVYKKYSDESDPEPEPNEKYWKWAREGWANPKAVRYPMGRGAKPEYSFWQGQRLGYIQARTKIYIPLYARAVAKTEAFVRLQQIYKSQEEIWLWDFDGYDRRKFGMTLIDVMTDPRKKMGHAFVLAMMLKWGKNFWRK